MWGGYINHIPVRGIDTNRVINLDVTATIWALCSAPPGKEKSTVEELCYHKKVASGVQTKAEEKGYREIAIFKGDITL